MIKRAVFREALQILNPFAPNNKASKHMRQKLMELKGEIDKPTSSFGDFTVSLSVIDRKGRLIISKNI